MKDFIIDENGVLNRYIGSGGDVVIPDGVTSIARSAILGCSRLKSLTIPDSVTSIDNSAFFNCSSLLSFFVSESNSAYASDDSGCLYNKERTTLIQYPIGNIRDSFEIPDGVIMIGEGAFDGCRRLVSVTIPDSVTSIGHSAFQSCNNLVNVTIPDSVTSIGRGAFSRCGGLTSVTIPRCVTSIDDSSFNGCSNLVSVTIPDGVRSIGNYAFFGCSSLASVTIPESVTSIGDSAFVDCNNLISVTIPNSVMSIGNEAFLYCKRLTSVTIPASVTSIGHRAFESCSSLMSVTIGNGVTSIGDEAFKYCKHLTSVTIPASVTEIGFGAFPWFTNVELPKGLALNHFLINKKGTLTDYAGSEENVVIPDGVIKIAEQAFSEPHFSYEMPKHKPYWVTLPKSVEKVENGAFINSSVSGFKVEESSELFKAENGVLLSKNGKKLILYPPKGNSDVCVIPDTVEEIDRGAFCGMNGEWSAESVKRQWVTIPKSVKAMDRNAFRWVPEDGGLTYEFIFNTDYIRAVPRPIYLGDLNDVAQKDKKKLVEGFLDAVYFDRPEIEPFEAFYADHIRKNIKSYIKEAFWNEPVFHFFIRNKLIPEHWISRGLIALEENNLSDLKPELLEYQQTNYG